MSTTTEKLAELLEAASSGPWTVSPPKRRSPSQADFLIHAHESGYVARMFCHESKVGCVDSLGPSLPTAEVNAKLLAAAPDLARLVVTLTEALDKVQNMPLLMKTWEKSSRDAAYDEIQAALDAVEELRL